MEKIYKIILTVLIFVIIYLFVNYLINQLTYKESFDDLFDDLYLDHINDPYNPYTDNYMNMYPYDGDSFMMNYDSYGIGMFKPYGNYEKPTTNLIFDKNNKLITMLDMLPSVNSQYTMKRVNCPDYYKNHPRFGDEFNEDITCWQKKY